MLHGRVIGATEVPIGVDNVQEVDCTTRSNSQLNGEITALSIELKTDFVIESTDLLELTYPYEAAENFQEVQSSAN